MERAPSEARRALRRLRRSPGFTAAALITLALGIGANALMFSVVNAMFLRPLPYREPDRLVWATEFFPKFSRSMAPAPEYSAWKRHSTAFERIEAMGIAMGANLTAPNRAAERVQAAHVTPGFFELAGVAPHLGAGFKRGDRDDVAIISDVLWRGYFGAGPGIVGKTLTLNGKPYTVAGVLPPDFVYPDGPDTAVWLPDAVPPAATVPGRGMSVVRVIGRLKVGVSIEQARTDLERVARGMDDQYPKPWSGYHSAASVRVVSLRKQLTAGSVTAAAVLMSAVGFLLLIACANVANLFLARAVARRKEMAVQAAVGASRGDIIFMLLVESVVAAAMGGALGIALLYQGRSAVQFLLPKSLAQDTSRSTGALCCLPLHAPFWPGCCSDSPPPSWHHARTCSPG